MKKENRELAVISPRMMDIMEHYIGMLERENELLKNDYNIADDGIDDLNDVVKDLRKENEELKAENKRLHGINAELVDNNKRLNDGFGLTNREDFEEIEKLRAEIKEKEHQYHILASSNTSHYPKEYREEAEMYFHHNPNTEKLWFFMVGDSEVDEDGDIRATLNVGVDAIAECDNLNGDVGLEVYK